MNDILRTVLPAVIALLGTIVVAFLGYRQWKRQQRTVREGDFRSQQQTTYKELWEKLEDIHVRLRTEIVDGEKFRSFVRDVNSYILKRGLYLEKGDQELANQYLSKVSELARLVGASNSPEAKEAVSITNTIPADVIQSLRQLGEVQKEVSQLREQILTRYRKILLGSSPSK